MLGIFFGSRASQWWGKPDSLSRSAGTVASTASAPLVGAATVTRNNAIASQTIAELQIGVQYEVAIAETPLLFFLRTGYEYQHWVTDGPPTGGTGFGGTIGSLTTNSFVSANGRPEALLHGVSFSTRVSW